MKKYKYPIKWKNDPELEESRQRMLEAKEKMNKTIDELIEALDRLKESCVVRPRPSRTGYVTLESATMKCPKCNGEVKKDMVYNRDGTEYGIAIHCVNGCFSVMPRR